MKKLLTGTVLLAAAFALPSENSVAPAKDTTPETSPHKTWHKLNQVARFENHEGLPLVAASPVGIYLDVFWQGMALTQTISSVVLSGVKPNTPSNYASYSKTGVATLKEGQPSMTTEYQDSTIDHLDLDSFYYGCVLSTKVSLFGKPKACTVSIEGYADGEGKKLVEKQSFEFKPTGGLVSEMMKAKVNAKFKGLKRVDFFVDGLLTAALIDTVNYTVYSEKKHEERRWTGQNVLLPS